MKDEINSIHIEYIKEKLDKMDTKLDHHIADEMHDFKKVQSDVNKIQIDMAAMREKHKNHTNFRTAVVAVAGAGLMLVFEMAAKKLFP